MRHCGLFGSKIYSEVCDEIKKKSNNGYELNYGLISLIVKSGDDLR